MVKLHGSLDWGICNKCNKLSLYFPHMVAKNYFGEGWPPVCRVGKCNGIIEPYIFVPHQDQGDDERINMLWDKAKEVLSQAQKITIIGYSFPEYDQKVIKLFKNSLDKKVEVEIIDYEPNNDRKASRLFSIKEKYKQMVPELQNEIRVSLDGFCQYLDSY